MADFWCKDPELDSVTFIYWIKILIYGNFFCIFFFQTVIVKLKLDKDRKKILERKAQSRARAMADKGKYTEETMES